MLVTKPAKIMHLVANIIKGINHYNYNKNIFILNIYPLFEDIIDRNYKNNTGIKRPKEKLQINLKT